MFRLVVLSALVAFVAAKPSGLLAYSAPAVAVPAAVSTQYRTDVISKPVVATYAAPAVVQKAVYAAAPAVAVPAAVSTQYRTDVISKPVVAAYAAPAVVQKAVVAPAVAVAPAPVALASAYAYQTRVDYPQPTIAVKAAPVAYAAPLTYSAPLTYAAPAPIAKAW